MSYIAGAKEKIQKEADSNKADGKVKAILPSVIDVLNKFSEQEPEFAQAIVQSDKTIIDCCQHILKGVGSSISDIEVYRRAVDFYFPGADVVFEMKINLTASVETAEKTLVIDITDFM